MRTTYISADGQPGVILHSKLFADGPLDEMTLKPLINPKTNKPYAGINEEMPYVLHDCMTAIAYSDDKHLAQPMFVYDHPALKEISTTMITDGTHLFIDADFMREQEATHGKQHLIQVLKDAIQDAVINKNTEVKNVASITSEKLLQLLKKEEITSIIEILSLEHEGRKNKLK